MKLPIPANHQENQTEKIGKSCAITILFNSLSGPPIIDIPPVDKNVLSGANVSFYCVGFADPTPQITWEKNSKTVEASDRIELNLKPESAKLRINSVTVGDAGTYECIYKNSHGEVRRSAVLTVDGQTRGKGQLVFQFS